MGERNPYKAKVRGAVKLDERSRRMDGLRARDLSDQRPHGR